MTPIDAKPFSARPWKSNRSTERSTYVYQACGDDLELRRRSRKPAAGGSTRPAASWHNPLGPGGHPRPAHHRTPGMQIGPYKLLQEIGEGGMGVVYMAEQHEPVAPQVALKIIKPGMDTRQVIARFEAERQALSLMDHPNIAKVLDAGHDRQSGRPYFVMELVKGRRSRSTATNTI